uniref:Uncharacterized protein n=1 Tax=Meloidogyne enterolobii TaxID=390850 RepID=A0A6V7UYS2_MELEN|nr:unnamed protein product [Meloidogyne enterolobii]
MVNAFVGNEWPLEIDPTNVQKADKDEQKKKFIHKIELQRNRPVP